MDQETKKNVVKFGREVIKLIEKYDLNAHDAIGGLEIIKHSILMSPESVRNTIQGD